MQRPRDPVQRATDGRDLYDVATWEVRSRLDRFAAGLYRALLTSARAAVVLLAVLILLAQLTLTGVATFDNPVLGAYILASVVPALALATYVWKSDATMHEPLRPLVITFMLGFLLAGFAALLNSQLQGTFEAIPLVGLVLFFYLVVGPVEETVKWLAVRLYAYRSDRFAAVVDGAVYGAVAGLGFATIENTIYLTQESIHAAGTGASVVLLQTAAARTFAGPGHVIYSAFAGYYLGLAKFNPENRGPIVVKGLLVAVFIHGTYNTAVTYLPVLTGLVPSLATLPDGSTFIGFVVLYDGFFGYLLYRKLARYRSTYAELGVSDSRRDDVDTPADATVAGRRGERASGASRADSAHESPASDSAASSSTDWSVDGELDRLEATEGDDEATERRDRYP